MDNILAFATVRGTARAELTATWLDGGTIEVYGGTRPLSPDVAITDQPLLAIFSLPTPAGTVANAVLTGGSIPAALVLANGNATWARLRDAASAVVGDCDVGATNSGALLELSDTALVSGAYITITSFTLTE